MRRVGFGLTMIAGVVSGAVSGARGGLVADVPGDTASEVFVFSGGSRGAATEVVVLVGGVALSGEAVNGVGFRPARDAGSRTKPSLIAPSLIAGGLGEPLIDAASLALGVRTTPRTPINYGLSTGLDRIGGR